MKKIAELYRSRRGRKIDCKTCRAAVADLLLDESYAPAHPEVAEHMAVCADCRQEIEKELEELRATSALLDSWAAPEPSAYFNVKLHARLREARAAGPESLWSRLRASLMYSTEHRLRPFLVGALLLVVSVGGGGTFAGLYEHRSPAVVQVSPAVNDLKLMDANAQALQEMNQLLDPSDNGSGAPPSS